MNSKIVSFIKATLSKNNKPFEINEKVFSLGKECIKFIESNEPTNSFLGGSPIVSDNINWPRKDESPLSFIAQLDLGEINKDKLFDWLPQKGRLLFFYDIEEQPWGFDPNDVGGFSVIYENGIHELHNLALPIDLKPEQILPATKYLSARTFISLPDIDLLKSEDIELIFGDEKACSEFDDDTYIDFIFENSGEYPHHQMGGFPIPVQGAHMEEECQLVSHGINCGEPEAYYSEKAKKLMKKENDWKLLFQFASDDDVDVMWGDEGNLYFWVRESEAKRIDFSKSWVILQCS